MVWVKEFIKSISNIHRQGSDKNICLLATPRGGSTWFMEMLWSQPRMKYCSEPFNVRNGFVARHLGISTFSDLYSDDQLLKLRDYTDGLSKNKFRFLNPNPFRKLSRFYTTRVIYKLIHYGMANPEYFESSFNAHLFFVFRHPIPVSMSREVFPLLEGFGRCRLRERFTNEQLQCADRALRSGSHLEKGVVAWCLHNSLPLNNWSDQWKLATYEQAVTEPSVVIDYLCRELELSSKESMLKQSETASAVKRKSSPDRQRLLDDPSRRLELVSSWKGKVSDAEEQDLMHTLEIFDIDIYQYGSVMPNRKYLI